MSFVLAEARLRKQIIFYAISRLEAAENLSFLKNIVLQ